MDEQGDVEAMANFVDWQSGSNMSPERREMIMKGAKEAGRGYPLIGTRRSGRRETAGSLRKRKSTAFA